MRKVGPRINYTLPKEQTRLNVKLSGEHQEAFRRLKDRFPGIPDAAICKMALSALDKALENGSGKP